MEYISALNTWTKVTNTGQPNFEQDWGIDQDSRLIASFICDLSHTSFQLRGRFSSRSLLTFSSISSLAPIPLGFPGHSAFSTSPVDPKLTFSISSKQDVLEIVHLASIASSASAQSIGSGRAALVSLRESGTEIEIFQKPRGNIVGELSSWLHYWYHASEGCCQVSSIHSTGAEVRNRYHYLHLKPLYLWFP